MQATEFRKWATKTLRQHILEGYTINKKRLAKNYELFLQAVEDIKKFGDLPVPLHIRNAPTKLMKELGYHKGYKYAHSFDNHFVDMQYLPEELKDKIYYFPTDIGEEEKIKKYLEKIWSERRKKK